MISHCSTVGFGIGWHNWLTTQPPSVCTWMLNSLCRSSPLWNAVVQNMQSAWEKVRQHHMINSMRIIGGSKQLMRPRNKSKTIQIWSIRSFSHFYTSSELRPVYASISWVVIVLEVCPSSGSILLSLYVFLPNQNRYPANIPFFFCQSLEHVRFGRVADSCYGRGRPTVHCFKLQLVL